METLDEDHPCTLDSKYELGRTLSLLDKDAEAIQLFRLLIQKQEETWGKDHSNTPQSKSQLRELLSARKDGAKTRKHEGRICCEVQRLEEMKGKKHSDTLVTKY